MHGEIFVNGHYLDFVTFLPLDVRIESLAAEILVHRIGLNTPSYELKFRPRGSMPESGGKKVQSRDDGDSQNFSYRVS